jgi:hypothetical protein
MKKNDQGDMEMRREMAEFVHGILNYPNVRPF